MEKRMGGHRISRRFLVLSFAAAPLAAWAACGPTRVLFVCQAGAVKSAIAREVLRSRVDKEGLAVQVASRGLHLEDYVPTALAANLRNDGIHPEREAALLLTARDVQRADVVIAFDDAANAPSLQSARTWRTPSWNSDYDAAKPILRGAWTALSPSCSGSVAGEF
jgi:protein-tyrosine-phosphatase